jgi:2,5-diketo-D-gluconate reductase A
MVAAMRMGLARAVGVSNFNSTNMQDLRDAGLPLPAANQIEWNPGIVSHGPYSHSDAA